MSGLGVDAALPGLEGLTVLATGASLLCRGGLTASTEGLDDVAFGVGLALPEALDWAFFVKEGLGTAGGFRWGVAEVFEEVFVVSLAGTLAGAFGVALAESLAGALGRAWAGRWEGALAETLGLAVVVDRTGLACAGVAFLEGALTAGFFTFVLDIGARLRDARSRLSMTG